MYMYTLYMYLQILNHLIHLKNEIDNLNLVQQYLYKHATRPIDQYIF